MKRNEPDYSQAYGVTPESFKRRVAYALRQTEKEQPMKKLSFRASVLIALLVLVLGTAAVAAVATPVADVFGWFYGEAKKEELLAGDVATIGQSYTLGDVTYTIDEVVYSNHVLYGTGTISVAEGKEAVLITEDYQVTDPAGYLLHYGMGEEEVPEDAPSYKELAEQKDCKILFAKLVPEGVLVDGEVAVGDIGYLQLPRPDNTIQFTFEVYDNEALSAERDDWTAQGGGWSAKEGEDKPASYTMKLYVGNWEVTKDGEWLREEPNNTWLREEWIVEVTPEVSAP